MRGGPLCADDWVVAQVPRVLQMVDAPKQELAGWKRPITQVFVEPNRKLWRVQQVLLEHIDEWREHPLL